MKIHLSSFKISALIFKILRLPKVYTRFDFLSVRSSLFPVSRSSEYMILIIRQYVNWSLAIEIAGGSD